jgi:Rad3-related DNA helicase
VNPAVNLQKFLEYGRSTIFFSATFLPIRYYKKLLSTEPDDYAVYVESPFDFQKCKLVVGRDVSSRYTKRGIDMYRTYASYMMEVSRAKKGNYMTFFPSYQFMQDVYDAWMELSDGSVDVIVQGQYMKEEEREQFLEAFAVKREKSLMGFCVMGGVFSEGIDLTEDRLIGALIVGTGLPQVCVEREILQNYFDANGENGFDYAYLYPGANKVLQAAGRVIRTESDRGAVLLLDERFLNGKYREIFPREWRTYEVCRLSEVEGILEKFWTEIIQTVS